MSKSQKVSFNKSANILEIQIERLKITEKARACIKRFATLLFQAKEFDY
jgi:hypothetical protein